MTTEEDEITLWMDQLEKGCEEASEKIWKHYYEKLLNYASRKMGQIPRRDADEEDIALSAMHSLQKGVIGGRFPKLGSRDDLWKLLLTIAGNKVKKRIRHQMALKRGAGAIRGESVFAKGGDEPAGFADLVGVEPTEDFSEQVSLELGELLDKLDDATLQNIVIQKLQGYSNEEIAEELNFAVRSIERKLNLIRQIWNSALE